MAESQEIHNEDEVTDSGRRRRSAARRVFPRVPISKVIPLLEAIWQEGHGDPVRATAAFGRLNRSSTSGTSRTLIASANSGYGLINGNASSTHLELTGAGKTIVGPSSNEERTSTILDALFSNEIFRTVHARYEHRQLPSDQIISDYIKTETGLSDEDATTCWDVIADNLRYSGLLVREGGREVVASREDAEPLEDETLESPQRPSDEAPEPDSARDVTTDAVLPAIPHAEFHFNVQIHLPSDASPEVYDSIFSSIARHLLQREA